MKTRSVSAASVGAALLASLLGLQACNSSGGGRAYTLGRADRSGALVPVEDVIEPRFDELVQRGDCLEIRLADHFLRYLNAFGTPEVVIFSRARIRFPDSDDDELVFDRVLMNTDDSDRSQVGMQGAGGTLRDAVLLPSMLYEGQEILLSLRVLELDQGDNVRVEKLIQAAAAGSAQFAAASAPQISAFQAVLSFLVANNADDVEFSIDIGLSSEGTSSFKRSADLLPGGGETSTFVLTPRVGTIAAIKTEHVSRMVIPEKYEQFLPQSLLWIVENAARLVTLDLFNALPQHTDYDAYSDFFGDPWRVRSNSLMEPTLRNGRLVHLSDIDDTQSEFELFAVRDLSLFTVPVDPAKTDLVPPAPRASATPTPFRDKSYMLFTTVRPERGLPVKELARLSDDLDELKIRTTSLSKEELDRLLDRIKLDVATRDAKAARNAGQRADAIQRLKELSPTDGRENPDIKRRVQEVNDVGARAEARAKEKKD